MTLSSWPLALCLLAVSACASSTPSADAPRSDGTPPGRPAADAPPMPMAPPPPQPVASTGAFHIMAIEAPSSTTAVTATVCEDQASCERALGGVRADAVTYFHQEKWVVITTLTGQRVESVTSDGTTVLVDLGPACDPVDPATKRPQFVLYRVAKSVTKATVRNATAKLPPCPRTP